MNFYIKAPRARDASPLSFNKTHFRVILKADGNQTRALIQFKKEHANGARGKYRRVFQTTRICRDNGCSILTVDHRSYSNPYSNYTINASPLLSLPPIFADCATNQIFSLGRCTDKLDTCLRSNSFQRLISVRTKTERESYHAR